MQWRRAGDGLEEAGGRSPSTTQPGACLRLLSRTFAAVAAVAAMNAPVAEWLFFNEMGRPPCRGQPLQQIPWNGCWGWKVGQRRHRLAAQQRRRLSLRRCWKAGGPPTGGSIGSGGRVGGRGGAGRPAGLEGDVEAVARQLRPRLGGVLLLLQPLDFVREPLVELRADGPDVRLRVRAAPTVSGGKKRGGGEGGSARSANSSWRLARF